MTLVRILAVTPLPGFVVRLTLSNGEEVERDLTHLLHGPIFDAIRARRSTSGRVASRGKAKRGELPAGWMPSRAFSQEWLTLAASPSQSLFGAHENSHRRPSDCYSLTGAIRLYCSTILWT